MTPTLLIDAIVRQTTVLIAALATSAGHRAPLAHVAEQVFTDLVTELKRQGLGHKVISDMFGMALRTYHARVGRFSESRTEHGRSVWEAVLSEVRNKGPMRRFELLQRFRYEDQAVLKGVLRDLTESGLVYSAGRGENLVYRAAADDDVSWQSTDPSALDSLLLVAIHAHGPLGPDALADLVPTEDAELQEAALARLVEAGLVEEDHRDGARIFSAPHCVIPLESAHGWEAAVFDHYQALVGALVTKLGRGVRVATGNDTTGGSTFVFDVWEGHPHRAEALNFLADLRERGGTLRRKIDEYNDRNQRPVENASERVTAYAGQAVRREEEC